jgi:hypothetical protein
MSTTRVSRSQNTSGTQNNAEEKNSARQVRLTVYTTGKKDFALRYLALKKRKSLNRLMNENLDRLLESSGIDPDTLPQNMP